MKTKPVRVAGRSREFQNYLDRQSPAERSAIEAGEAAYLKALPDRLGEAERIYAEQMRGVCELPAGASRAARFHLLFSQTVAGG